MADANYEAELQVLEAAKLPKLPAPKHSRLHSSASFTHFLLPLGRPQDTCTAPEKVGGIYLTKWG